MSAVKGLNTALLIDDPHGQCLAWPKYIPLESPRFNEEHAVTVRQDEDAIAKLCFRKKSESTPISETEVIKALHSMQVSITCDNSSLSAEDLKFAVEKCQAADPVIPGIPASPSYTLFNQGKHTQHVR